MTDAAATFWLDDVIEQHRSRWFLRRSAKAIIQAISQHPLGAALHDNPRVPEAVHAGLRYARWQWEGEDEPSPEFVVRNTICQILGASPVNELE